MYSGKAFLLASFSTALFSSAALATPTPPHNDVPAACLIGEGIVPQNQAPSTEPSQPSSGSESSPEAAPSQPSIVPSENIFPPPTGARLDSDLAPFLGVNSSPQSSILSPNVSQSLPSAPSAVPSIQVKQVEVTGSTLFGSKELDPLVQPLRGQTVSIQRLQAVVNQITELYIQGGYITSYAELETAHLSEGIVSIRVIEGRVAEIRVSGLRRLNRDYVCSRLRSVTAAPVNANRLEENLRLLKIDPLFKSVEAILQRRNQGVASSQESNPQESNPQESNLQQDSQAGESILQILVVEADPIELELDFNNHVPSTIAEQQATAGFRYRDLTGLGDEIAFSYSVGLNVTDFPRAALNIYDLTYRVPLNSQEGALQLRAIYSTSAITAAEFDQLGFRGNAESYEVVYRQPLIRSLREEFALSAGFTFQNSQSFIFDNEPNPFELGPDSNGYSRTRVLRLGQDYVRRDSHGAWALQSQFNIGLGILDATENSGSIPDGQFFSWLGQVARFQDLGNDFRLIVRNSWQLSTNPLLSSQQFFLGGASSLRGYPPNVRRGDNGWSLGVEGRIPLIRNRSGKSIFQLAPFAELGYVWNDPANPNPENDVRFLSDLGLSFLYQPTDRLSLQLDVALPLINLDNQRGALQDNGVYFSAGYRF